MDKRGQQIMSENPFLSKVLGKRIDEIKRSDFIAFHEHEMNQYRSLPDVALNEVKSDDGKMMYFYMTQGKTETLRLKEENFRKNLPLTIL